MTGERRLATVVAVIALVKSLELVIHGLAWVYVLPLAAGGLAMLLVRPAIVAWSVAAGALLVNITPYYRNHLALLFWVALVLTVFPEDRQQRVVLRCVLSTMYGFAAVAKLWPDWLSGDVLVAATWTGPLLPRPALLGVVALTIAVELALAWGPWSRWRGWFWLAVATHAGFVAFTQPDPWDVGRLTVFGVLSLSVWLRAAVTFTPDPAPRTHDPGTDTPDPGSGPVRTDTVQ